MQYYARFRFMFVLLFVFLLSCLPAIDVSAAPSNQAANCTAHTAGAPVVNIRTGPGASFEPINAFGPNDVVDVVLRSDNGWVQVRMFAFGNMFIGFVPESDLTLEGECASVPVVPASNYGVEMYMNALPDGTSASDVVVPLDMCTVSNTGETLVDIYSQPDANSQVIGKFAPGPWLMAVPPVGSSWVQVTMLNGVQGWVVSSQIRLNGTCASATALPSPTVYAPLPTDPPIPTPYLSPTPPPLPANENPPPQQLIYDQPPADRCTAMPFGETFLTFYNSPDPDNFDIGEFAPHAWGDVVGQTGTGWYEITIPFLGNAWIRADEAQFNGDCSAVPVTYVPSDGSGNTLNLPPTPPPIAPPGSDDSGGGQPDVSPTPGVIPPDDDLRTPVPIGDLCTAISDDGETIRVGPGEEYKVYGSLQPDVTYVGLTISDNGWIELGFQDGDRSALIGWVNLSAINVSARCDDLPLVRAQDYNVRAWYPQG